MSGIFVTGTDTGVGKSVVTGLLARYLLERGRSVITQKWIQTGSSNGDSPLRGQAPLPLDIQEHLKIMGVKRGEVEDYLDFICPYNFKFAASPHLASRIEGKRINKGKIIRSFKFLSGKFNFVIVEGLGGALVPFDHSHLLIDIVKELSIPVLIVSRNKLGTINHTLLTIEALRKRKLKIAGVLFNNPRRENKDILKDNPRIVEEISREKLLGALPWEEQYDKLYLKFKPAAAKLIRELRYE